jgi:hypothetical protein
MKLNELFIIKEGRQEVYFSKLLDQLKNWNGVVLSYPRDNTVLVSIPGGEEGLPDVNLQFDIDPVDGEHIASIRIPGTSKREPGKMF